MKITSLNIQRGFFKKFYQIEAFAKREDTDVMFLSEVDIHESDFIPRFFGFSKNLDRGAKHRVIAYVKNKIEVKQIHYPGGLPCVVLNTAQSTVASIYNDFTVNGVRLKENERTKRLLECLE